MTVPDDHEDNLQGKLFNLSLMTIPNDLALKKLIHILTFMISLDNGLEKIHNYVIALNQCNIELMSY